MITTLLPYLRHHYGDNVLRSFSSDAAARLERATWNDELKCLETPEDRNIELLLECDADLDFTTKFPAATVEIVGVPRPDPNQLASQQTAALNHDDDTVSTLRGTGTRIPPTAIPPASATDAAAAPSSDSIPSTAATTFSTAAQSISNTSMASFTSRVSTMEERLTRDFADRKSR